MARRFKEEITNWIKGAITSDSPDALPKNASPRARNTAWLAFGQPARRKGCEVLTSTGQVDGANPKPAVLAMGHAHLKTANVNWGIFSSGHWSKMSAGAWSAIDAANVKPFTAGTKNYSSAVAKDFLFVVNGTDKFKTDGTTITNFGLAASAAPTVIDEGTAGNPNGTYRIALTRFNSNSGHESSLSVFGQVAVVNKKIKATFPATAFTGDTQTTHIRVHIFKVGLTDRFWRLTATNVTPDAGTFDSVAGGYTSATSFVTIDVTDTNINDLIVQSPSTQENNPPPTGTTFIGWHGSRMFATDGKYLFYSKIDNPEAFDPDVKEPVDTENSFDIIAFSTLDEEHLVIIKEIGVYALIGPNDPNVWEIKEIDLHIGISAPRTLKGTEGALWWVYLQALYRLRLGEKPQRIDMAISDKFENLNETVVKFASAEYDVLRQRLFFAIPTSGQSRNNIILPYNTKLNVWEDEWNPMDISTLGTWNDETKESPFVTIGNYKGRAFRLWKTPYVDGVRVQDGATIFTLKGNPTSVTLSTVTDTGATFDTVGDGLAQIPVILVSTDKQAIRGVIASNTATVLTLEANLGVLPDTTWTYYIGAIDFQFDTKYLAPSAFEESSIFVTRTFKQILVKGISDTGDANLDIFAIIDHVDEPFRLDAQVILEGGGAVFDIDKFDEAIFGTLTAKTIHKTLGKRGRVIGLRFVDREPLEGVMLLGVGVLGTEFGIKA